MVDQPETYRIKFITPNHSKLRRPSSFVVLPAEIVSYIGQITLIWGMFDNDFQEFLFAMMALTHSKDDAWTRFPFDRKDDLFRKKLSEIFRIRPAIHLLLLHILDEALALQIKRDLLVHGRIIVKTERSDENGESKVTLIATGRKKRRIVEEYFTEDDIESLYYDLAHLSGKMAQFKYPNKRSFLNASWQDRYFLLDFLANCHPSLSNQSIHGYPPPPSPNLIVTME